jgi:hypothetical protein
MCSAVGTVDFFVFTGSSVSLTAHVEHFAPVAISAQHLGFNLLLMLFAVYQLLIKICNMCMYIYDMLLLLVGTSGTVWDLLLHSTLCMFAKKFGI